MILAKNACEASARHRSVRQFAAMAFIQSTPELMDVFGMTDTYIRELVETGAIVGEVPLSSLKELASDGMIDIWEEYMRLFGYGLRLRDGVYQIRFAE